jgi:DNA-directed RNA polymerase II subunit RPB2
MISHGAANFLRDKMFIDSDRFKIYVCSKCGLMATANLKTKCYSCKVCKTDNTDDVVKIDIPYATKLLFQELMAMGIAPRIKTNLHLLNAKK